MLLLTWTCSCSFAQGTMDAATELTDIDVAAVGGEEPLVERLQFYLPTMYVQSLAFLDSWARQCSNMQ